LPQLSSSLSVCPLHLFRSCMLKCCWLTGQTEHSRCPACINVCTPLMSGTASPNETLTVSQSIPSIHCPLNHNVLSPERWPYNSLNSSSPSDTTGMQEIRLKNLSTSKYGVQRLGRWNEALISMARHMLANGRVVRGSQLTLKSENTQFTMVK